MGDGQFSPKKFQRGKNVVRKIGLIELTERCKPCYFLKNQIKTRSKEIILAETKGRNNNYAEIVKRFCSFLEELTPRNCPADPPPPPLSQSASKIEWTLNKVLK